MKQLPAWACIGLGAGMTAISAGAAAQEASPNQGLLGDWDGARTRLYQRGIDFQLSFTSTV